MNGEDKAGEYLEFSPLFLLKEKGWWPGIRRRTLGEKEPGGVVLLTL